jgi:GDP-L-fucose synthase
VYARDVPTTFWTRKRVLVTGGAGFFGSHVTERIAQLGATVVVPRSADYDLVQWTDCLRVVGAGRFDVVFHLAALCGGIGANRAAPGQMIYANAAMGLHVLEACRKTCVPKLVIAGTVCAYPKFAPVPFREDDLWNGYPEETNAPYGIAKKMLLVAAQAYREQFGTSAIFVLPTNLYGPRDNFDPDTSHVIPAMIRKFAAARQDAVDTVTLWGDGTPTRDFLYVEDAADAIIRAAERYDDPAPMNLGTGVEISMASLASIVADAVGYTGRTVWDTSMPGGQPRRCLDTTRARECIGWSSRTSLDDGIAKTVAWYERQPDW